MRDSQMNCLKRKKRRWGQLGRPRVSLEDFSEMLNFEPEQKKMSASVPGMGMDGASDTKQMHDGILEMDFSAMKPFSDHKFKLYEGQQLADMVESIRQFGILLPIILWHNEAGQYIILSGHNRCNAARLAGLDKGPVIIKENLTYEEAVLIVTETNLRQRSFGDMSHSERAYCLAQHYQALKSQGRRNDLLAEIEILLNPHESNKNETCAQIEHKLKSRDKIGKEYGLSHAKVARYIRLAELNAKLLERVDTGEIAFLAAYDLSFIEDTKKQQQIAELIELDNYKVDMKKAELLRSYFESGKLNETTAMQILSGEKTGKPKSNKPQPFKVKPAVITKYFTKGQSVREIEDTIEKALALYFEKEREGTG